MGRRKGSKNKSWQEVEAEGKALIEKSKLMRKREELTLRSNVSYGIFVSDDGNTGWRRPKSKKDVKEHLEKAVPCIQLENTRFGYEEITNLALVKPGKYDFVGPDPSRSRKFYGTLEAIRHEKSIEWKVS